MSPKQDFHYRWDFLNFSYGYGVSFERGTA